MVRTAALSSPLVHWCGRGLDAEAWALEVRPRERTGVACVRLKRLECDSLGCTWKMPRPTREARHHCLRGGCKESSGSNAGASFSLYTLRQQNSACTNSWGMCELPLPSWAPKMGTGHLFQTTSRCQASHLWTQKGMGSSHHYKLQILPVSPRTTPSTDPNGHRELPKLVIPPTGHRTCPH